MTWRPMSENPFPWNHRHVLLAAYDQDDAAIVEVFRAHCGEHGAYFERRGGMLSINEQGWIPFAWKDDDTPERDDDRYPPMLVDYLTGWSEDANPG